MSDVLSRLRARRRHETTLRSGLTVGFHYPDLNECILKIGAIPLGTFQANGEGAEPTEEEAARFLAEQPDAVEKGIAYQRAVVATMLDDIDGVQIGKGDDRDEIAAALEPEERQELFLIGTRQREPDSGEA